MKNENVHMQASHCK